MKQVPVELQQTFCTDFSPYRRDRTRFYPRDTGSVQTFVTRYISGPGQIFLPRIIGSDQTFPKQNRLDTDPMGAFRILPLVTVGKIIYHWCTNHGTTKICHWQLFLQSEQSVGITFQSWRRKFLHKNPGLGKEMFQLSLKSVRKFYKILVKCSPVR